jgi:hypothetical protein
MSDRDFASDKGCPGTGKLPVTVMWIKKYEVEFRYSAIFISNDYQTRHGSVGNVVKVVNVGPNWTSWPRIVLVTNPALLSERCIDENGYLP